MSTATAGELIEHIVLFKVKKEADPSEAAAMVNGLNSLASLDQVLHLTAGPILHFRSSSILTFTHMLHIRFQSKQDLHSYSVHPSHLRLVNDSKPIVEDIMAVDWITDSQPDPNDQYSAMRITFFKPKHERGAGNLLSSIATLKDRFPSISFGENFSPERAKGFSVGSILTFPSPVRLDAIDSIAEVEEKAAEIIVVDFVTNQKQQVAGGVTLSPAA